MSRDGDRFARLVPVVGPGGLERLARSRVMVLGLGGVGGSCVEALARGGVGSLVLVDGDVVVPSNLNRQAVALERTLGMPKAEAARELVAQVNPACEVTALPELLGRDTVAEQLDALPGPDYVVDAIDSVSQKLAVALWAQGRGVPLLSSMGGANKLRPDLLRFSDVSETSGDALARVMRRECRRRGIARLEVLWSPEPARAPADGAPAAPDGRPVLGTTSYLPPIMGLTLAGRVLCELSGLGWGDAR